MTARRVVRERIDPRADPLTSALVVSLNKVEHIRRS